MSEVTAKNPVIEKVTTILSELDNLAELIEATTNRLSLYLLPMPEEKCKEIGHNDEQSFSPLEDYLIRILEKIDGLKIRLNQLHSRIR